MKPSELIAALTQIVSEETFCTAVQDIDTRTGQTHGNMSALELLVIQGKIHEFLTKERQRVEREAISAR